MTTIFLRTLLIACMASALTVPASAQDTPEPASPQFKTGPDGSRCELRIWPIENYFTDMSGLLSAIPVFGFAVDQGARKNRSKAIRSLMGEFLGPETQIDLLRKQEVAKTLGLEDYKVIVEEAFPSDEARKKSKELQKKRKARFALLKEGKRLTNSQSSCYAELAITAIVYRKTVQFDSNMFIIWSYKYYGDSPYVQKEFSANSGGVPAGLLKHFPPTAESDVEPAKQELRTQFTRGFLDFARKVPR